MTTLLICLGAVVAMMLAGSLAARAGSGRLLLDMARTQDQSAFVGNRKHQRSAPAYQHWPYAIAASCFFRLDERTSGATLCDRQRYLDLLCEGVDPGCLDAPEKLPAGGMTNATGVRMQITHGREHPEAPGWSPFAP